MPRYEYKVVPAPTRGLKGKGVKGAEERFSHAIQELMNGLAGYGWEYQRAETLPSVERSGLTSTTTEWRNVLVFRRLRESDAHVFTPELLPAPAIPEPSPAIRPEPQRDDPVAADVPSDDTEEQNVAAVDNAAGVSSASADKHAATRNGAADAGPWDNGVEDTSTMSDDTALRRYAAARNSSKPEA